MKWLQKRNQVKLFANMWMEIPRIVYLYTFYPPISLASVKPPGRLSVGSLESAERVLPEHISIKPYYQGIYRQPEINLANDLALDSMFEFDVNFLWSNSIWGDHTLHFAPVQYHNYVAFSIVSAFSGKMNPILSEPLLIFSGGLASLELILRG